MMYAERGSSVISCVAVRRAGDLALGDTYGLNRMRHADRSDTPQTMSYCGASRCQPIGVPVTLATFDDASAGLTFRPLARLLLDETYIYSRLSQSSSSIFNNHIVRSKVNYQFTRALSLRGILDYNGVLPNPAAVALDRRKHLTADVLLTYLVHPGTALYIGYTDGYDNLRRDPQEPAPAPLRLGGGPTVSTGRQIFVKTSYLFRF